MKKFYQEGNNDLENPNIVVDEENKSIELQPYTDELCLKFIKPLLELIRLKFDDEYSVDLSCDHTFDGLRETNVALLKAGGEIIDNYDGESLTLSSIT